MYNKCLRFSEYGSENTSLVYANRAFRFFHTQKYSECLKDIDLAIAANHPPELLPKLMELKKLCEEMQGKSNEQKKEFHHQLSFPSHEKFPCMANVLEIAEDEEFGRHIVANCDIEIGKTVLVEENYMAQFSRRFYSTPHCYTCTKIQQNFIACPKCTDVMFCDKTCLEKNEFHQKFCGANFERMLNHIKFIIKSVLIGISVFTSVDEMMEFVKDTLVKRETQVPETAIDAKSKYALFLNLTSPRKNEFDVETTHKIYCGLLDIPSIKNMFESQQSQRFLMHLIAEHVSIISSNIVAQRWCSTVNQGYFTTIASVYLFFNHSCDSNLFSFRDGNKVVCITIRPIKRGEQLFVKYFHKMAQDRFYGRRQYSTEERQRFLLYHWRFLCKCSKCEASCKPRHSARMKSDENYQFLLCASKNDYKDTTGSELTTKCIKFLKKYSHLPWSNEKEFVSDVYSRCLNSQYKQKINCS